MITVDKQSRVPVYEQIKNQIMTLIHLGVFPVNSKLPSIRSVSTDTSVNINTVKKAFSDLEMSGVIYTVPGTGCFVSEKASDNNVVKNRIIQDIKEEVQKACSVGISKEDVLSVINEVYSEVNND